jgi:hypothetical protein
LLDKHNDAEVRPLAPRVVSDAFPVHCEIQPTPDLATGPCLRAPRRRALAVDLRRQS